MRRFGAGMIGPFPVRPPNHPGADRLPGTIPDSEGGRIWQVNRPAPEGRWVKRMIRWGPQDTKRAGRKTACP